MGAPLLAVLVARSLLAGIARRYDVSAPLALVVAGLLAGLIPGAARHRARTGAGAVRDPAAAAVVGRAGEQLRRACARNVRPDRAAGGRAAPWRPRSRSGVVAFHTVPELTIAAALTLGAIVAPPDAVSAAAIGRRLGLPRQIMTLLGGESLLNDATALTAYKVALAAAIGTAATWRQGVGHVRAWRPSAGRVVGGADRLADRLHPDVARRPAGGERDRVGRAVLHLPARRGGPRLRASSPSSSPRSSSASARRARDTPRACRTQRCGGPPSSCWSRSHSC